MIDKPSASVDAQRRFADRSHLKLSLRRFQSGLVSAKLSRSKNEPAPGARSVTPEVFYIFVSLMKEWPTSPSE